MDTELQLDRGQSSGVLLHGRVMPKNNNELYILKS
jgi:hypothetical protein